MPKYTKASEKVSEVSTRSNILAATVDTEKGRRIGKQGHVNDERAFSGKLDSEEKEDTLNSVSSQSQYKSTGEEGRRRSERKEESKKNTRKRRAVSSLGLQNSDQFPGTGAVDRFPPPRFFEMVLNSSPELYSPLPLYASHNSIASESPPIYRMSPFSSPPRPPPFSSGYFYQSPRTTLPNGIGYGSQGPLGSLFRRQQDVTNNIALSPASAPHAPKTSSITLNTDSVNNEDICDIDNTSYSASIEVSPEERAGSCWLGAVNALHHIQTKYSQFEAVFSLAGVPIEDDSLEIYAGFDEGLIQDGVGFMEQIHISLSTDIPMGKTLLSKIGRIASPFSCTVFTPAGRFSPTLFREDGSTLTLNQLVLETNIGIFNRTSASKPRGLSERSTSSKIRQLDTPYDQTGGNERPEGFSYNRTAAESGTSASRSERDGRSGSDNQPKSNKDADKSDRDGSGDENNEDSNSSDRQSKVHRLEKPEFEVSFLLSANVPDGTCGNPIGPAQHIRTEGQVMIKMGTDERSNDTTCDVRFDDLRIESSGGVGETAYQQFYLIVKVDSNQKNARIRNIRPEHTLTYDPQSIITSSRKSSKSTGFNFAISLALSPGMNGGGSRGKGSESATSSEKKEYTSKIRRYGRDGILYWGFDIDDPSERMAGKRLDERHRPAALFLYHTGEDYGSEKKQDIEIQVISCWSILGNKDPKFSRSGKIRRKNGKGKASVRQPVFSNILLKTALTIPTTSTSSSIYCGEVMFPYGEETGPHHHKVERDQGPAKGDSYASTSHIADPIKLLMSTLARDRKFAASNTDQAEDSGTDSTATSTVVMVVKDQPSKISQDALSEESSSTSEVANTLTSWLTKNLPRKTEAGHAQKVNQLYASQGAGRKESARHLVSF